MNINLTTIFRSCLKNCQLRYRNQRAHLIAARGVPTKQMVLRVVNRVVACQASSPVKSAYVSPCIQSGSNDMEKRNVWGIRTSENTINSRIDRIVVYVRVGERRKHCACKYYTGWQSYWSKSIRFGREIGAILWG